MTRFAFINFYLSVTKNYTNIKQIHKIISKTISYIISFEELTDKHTVILFFVLY